MNSTTPKDIRHRPGWQVNLALRRAGETQIGIARTLRCSQAMVSKAILRQAQPSALVERIWAEIARVVAQRDGNGGR